MSTFPILIFVLIILLPNATVLGLPLIKANMRVTPWNKKGFTLTELMVVVALIGILSAVAVPSYKKYAAKSRSTEAKMQMASIYTAEQGAFSEWGTYVGCLATSGFSSGVSSGRVYAVGFDTALNDGAATWGNAFVRMKFDGNCSNGNDSSYFEALKIVSGTNVCNLVDIDNCIPSTVDYTQSTFTAGAGGRISNMGAPSGTPDQWVINNAKKLIHYYVGF